MNLDLGIATDAWYPQVNGVVTTLTHIEGHLIHSGVRSRFYTPSSAKLKIKFPFYKHMSFGLMHNFARHDAYYISTPEGPIGMAAARFCLDNGIPYITGFHTDWAAFFKSYCKIPNWVTESYMKWVHQGADKIFVPSKFTELMVRAIGIKQPVTILKRGVNRAIFHPMSEHDPRNVKHQAVYVGRVSKEKGVEDFLKLKHIPLVCIGDGPSLPRFKRDYPHVKFMGELTHQHIAPILQESSVFVFPSKADTFGLVMLEALACGTPVLAYPVRAANELIVDGWNGILRDNLQDGIKEVNKISRQNVVDSVKDYTWANVTDDFICEFAKLCQNQS